MPPARKERREPSEYLSHTRQTYHDLLASNQGREVSQQQKFRLDECIRGSPASFKTVAYMNFRCHQTKVNLMNQNFMLSKQVRQMAVSPDKSGAPPHPGSKYFRHSYSLHQKPLSRLQRESRE